MTIITIQTANERILYNEKRRRLIFDSDSPIFDETLFTNIAQTTNAKNSITARETAYRRRILSSPVTERKQNQ